MKLEKLATDSLQIQTDYNVRTAKEVTANAKDIAQLMEACGDNADDPRFIVRYITDGKTKYTRSHATLEAAKLRGWKEVSAVKVAYEIGTPADALDLIFSNNAGHPIDRRSQGLVFLRLRNGVEVDQSEAIAAAKVGEEIVPQYSIEPMTLAEIGEACGEAFGKKRTGAHVSQCIAIAEAFDISPDLAALIEEDKISEAILPTVTTWATKKGDDEPKAGKMLAICRRAIAKAKEMGDDRATKKHMDAIKSEFVPLKAVATGNGATGTPAKKDDSGAQEPNVDLGGAPQGSDATGGENEEPEAELLPSEPEPPKEPTKKALATIRQTLLTVILETDSEIDDDLAQRLADRLVDAKLIVSDVPF